MTDAEIRLRCLEMAIAQAKIEGFGGDRNKIAEIVTWFYNRIVIVPPDVADKPASGRKQKADTDKSPPIFE